jgi:hypothetical protein
VVNSRPPAMGRGDRATDSSLQQLGTTFRMPETVNQSSERLSRAIKIVRRQLDCSEPDALVVMHTRIANTRMRLEDLAPLIIEGIIRFDA